jgi:dimethylhistidine N-methyltransferase
MNIHFRENNALCQSVLGGLSQPQKTLESKWFYDKVGSALFEEITALPEYYPTEAEKQILAENTHVWSSHVPCDSTLLELGSGASIKTQILLDALPQIKSYVPVDISEQFLKENARRLRKDYPALQIKPVVADFMQPFALPDDLSDGPLIGFFPGSTLGNLEPSAAINLLKMANAWPKSTGFVLGIDLVKDTQRLINAYDDSQGVTAAFNLNLLRRLNRELHSDFDLKAFQHLARWNEDLARIEMHLVSTKRQSVVIAGQEFRFEKDESIHTENSHKYTRDSISHIVTLAGWNMEEYVVDKNREFAVCVLTK